MFTGLADPSLWVAIAFFGFVALLVYYKVPAKITEALDDRADQIKAELDEAIKLREDAQNVLADYQRKQRDAQKEAEEIITQAKKEAESLAIETEQKLTEQLERRTQQAEEKIARAELQAINEVQTMAAEMSVQAAEHIMRKSVTGDKADSLIDEAIGAISGNFTRN
ncbi:MAG: F0F1 ATP synthase subunit B [bacterium]|nr:F0F1 ATP synthase subunit B [bacterium]